MSYDEDSYKKSGNEPHIISCILSSIVFFACLLWITFSTPDDFKCGWMFFGKFPVWMNVVYVFGIMAVSAFISFTVFCALELIFDKTESRKIRYRKMREPKVKRTYKF